MSAATAIPFEDSAAGRRGVLASYDAVTPAKATDEIGKFKITLRDALWLLMGCIAMYGAQFAAQYGMRSDIRDLSTQFTSYQQKQQSTDYEFQRQLDEIRKESALNRIKVDDAAREAAELKGILLGAGIKGAQK